jgi:hydrogenase nickel incorporation protein HypB
MCQPPPQPADHLPPLPQPLLRRNNHHALDNRRRFRAAGVRVINLLSAPGSGKTALLEAMALAWGRTLRMAVLVGDQATERDARRLRACGLEAIAISTGGLCHLEAARVAAAIDHLPLMDLDLLVIENVGNLVCPAAYDLGEGERLVMVAVGEGEDKPLKYPDLFQSADGVVINKLDLLAAVGDDLAETQRHIARVAPRAWTVALSARTGENLEALRQALDLPAKA